MISEAYLCSRKDEIREPSPLLVITAFFLVIAGVMGFILYNKVNTTTAYDRNNAPSSDSTVYVEVSDITTELEKLNQR